MGTRENPTCAFFEILLAANKPYVTPIRDPYKAPFRARGSQHFENEF